MICLSPVAAEKESHHDLIPDVVFGDSEGVLVAPDFNPPVPLVERLEQLSTASSQDELFQPQRRSVVTSVREQRCTNTLSSPRRMALKMFELAPMSCQRRVVQPHCHPPNELVTVGCAEDETLPEAKLDSEAANRVSCSLDIDRSERKSDCTTAIGNIHPATSKRIRDGTARLNAIDIEDRELRTHQPTVATDHLSTVGAPKRCAA